MTDIHQRKKVITLFSQHCKNAGLGKVNATKVLANYFHEGEEKSDLENRELFINKWQEIIGTVINKPDKTSLSKAENSELYKFLKGYVGDVCSEQYEKVAVNIAYEYLARCFDIFVDGIQFNEFYNDPDSDVRSYIPPDEFYGKVLKVTSSEIDNKSKSPHARYVVFHKAENINNIGVICNCSLIEFLDEQSNSVRKYDENKRIMRGVLVAHPIKDGFYHTGLMFDEFNRTTVTAIFTDSYAPKEFDESILTVATDPHLFLPFLRMESYGNYFDDGCKFGSNIIGNLGKAEKEIEVSNAEEFLKLKLENFQ